MNTTKQTAPAPHLRRAATVLAAAAAGLAVWAVAGPLAGVDLDASGQHVGGPQVALTGLLAGAVSWLLLTGLERFTSRPRRAWTMFGGISLVLSCTGPFTADGVAAGAVLVLLHLAVGLTLLLGLRATLKDAPCAPAAA
ncbi:DUF6069 family protein [Actinomadura parmotrematis]|uniref:Transmembrane protein n=1 Tax=Actinomadura parmotrematis TaxID=2864039 RepID=A0ABS7G2K4_9ACTN|nr:DUF6069 family protein [Actinomadura parmotrematis]MBW8486948.1 hypothetical protein [Actinomadura parmotrematis]